MKIQCGERLPIVRLVAGMLAGIAIPSLGSAEPPDRKSSCGERVAAQEASVQVGGLYFDCPNGTLYYRDADGDGYGDPALENTSCDGTIPEGYVANQGDCNDANASVHPGAVELCSNSLDDDCNGAVDDAIPPGPIVSVMMRGDLPAIEWAPVPAAQAYDVVYGDLGTLQTSAGDFTAATAGCVALQATMNSTSFDQNPSAGQGYWLVVRGDNCAGAGTYDSGDPAQVGSRDAGIEASGHPCTPSFCGDGACNGTETCSTCPGDCGVCACVTDADCQPNLCCYPTDCIPVWMPQPCPFPICNDTGYLTCLCQNGACVGSF